MTIFKGVYNTLAQPGPSFTPVGDGLGGGNVKVIYDQYTIPASGFADGDSINMGPELALKKGDIVLGLHVWHEAMGSSVVCHVGDDGDDDRYAASLDVAAASTVPKNANTFGGAGYQLTQDRQLRLKLAGAAPTAAKTIKLAVAVVRK